MAELVMPRLSDSMEEGTILQWMKQVGDEVAVGDEVVEIETDKANMAYESDTAGTLTEILAQEGETLPIGTPIARIGDPDEGQNARSAGPVGAGDPPPLPVAKASSGEVPPTPPPAEGTSRPTTAQGSGAGTSGEAAGQTAQGGQGAGTTAAGSGREAEQPADYSNQPSAGADPSLTPSESAEGPGERQKEQAGDTRIKASPVARRMAREKGVDLAAIEGSGPNGRVVKSDVERAAPDGGGESAVQAEGAGEGAPAAAPQGAAAASRGPEPIETAKGKTTYEEPSKLQATVARRMAESKATAPHFYLTVEIDMGKAVKARKRIKKSAGKKETVPSFNDMVVKACALALREHPRANGAYRDGRFELYSRVNVGVAVAARDALVVPTVFDADQKGLGQIAEEARALATRVREGTITPPELSGATFTVSNLGMFGIGSFSAVINPPQAAILAVGAIEERPAVRDGELVAAQLMSATLACDHRILYGADGARFLARVRELLEDPVLLAL